MPAYIYKNLDGNLKVVTPSQYQIAGQFIEEVIGNQIASGRCILEALQQISNKDRQTWEHTDHHFHLLAQSNTVLIKQIKHPNNQHQKAQRKPKKNSLKMTDNQEIIIPLDQFQLWVKQWMRSIEEDQLLVSIETLES